MYETSFLLLSQMGPLKPSLEGWKLAPLERALKAAGVLETFLRGMETPNSRYAEMFVGFP